MLVVNALSFLSTRISCIQKPSMPDGMKRIVKAVQPFDWPVASTIILGRVARSFSLLSRILSTRLHTPRAVPINPNTRPAPAVTVVRSRVTWGSPFCSPPIWFYVGVAHLVSVPALS